MKKKEKKRAKVTEEKVVFNGINYENFVPVGPVVSLKITLPHLLNTPKNGEM